MAVPLHWTEIYCNRCRRTISLYPRMDLIAVQTMHVSSLRRSVPECPCPCAALEPHTDRSSRSRASWHEEGKVYSEGGREHRQKVPGSTGEGSKNDDLLLCQPPSGVNRSTDRNMLKLEGARSISACDIHFPRVWCPVRCPSARVVLT